MKQTRKPTHPGVFFKSEILDERGISIADSAIELGVTEEELSEFTNGKVKCSIAMARLLSCNTGTGVDVWIKMQTKLDLWEVSRN